MKKQNLFKISNNVQEYSNAFKTMGLNFQGEIPVFVDHKREDLLHNIKRINNEYSECYKTTLIYQFLCRRLFILVERKNWTTNGSLREYFSKKTDLSDISYEYLNKTLYDINYRQRKYWFTELNVKF